ncbi:MAG: multicopper oxidase family protein [Candidatus Andersenbacteria bacterium]
MNTQWLKHKREIVIGILLVGGLVWFAGQYKEQAAPMVFSVDTTGLPEAVSMPVVELKDGATYDLVAEVVQKKINGKEFKMLAYNRSIPGPLITVAQGSEITVNLMNKTDVETTLHPHGVRVDNAFDGIPDVTQEVIPVGGMFTYRLKFPDAGMYWYHPHVREDYAQELGLYGNFLVTPAEASYWAPANREVPIVLDDILIENGQIAPFYKDETTHTLMGRFGNTMLINGETEYGLDVQRGEVVRFFVTNAANTRTFMITIPGAKMKLVGSDGGKYEQETFVDSVIISPSERATIDVLFEDAGAYALQHTTPFRTYTLGIVQVSNQTVSPSYTTQFAVPRVNEDIRLELAALRPLFTKAADKRLRIGIDMGTMHMMEGAGNHKMSSGLLGQEALAQMSDPAMGPGQHMMPDGGMMNNSIMMGSGEPVEWEDNMPAMNSNSTTASVQWRLIDEDTGQSNMDIDWGFKQGDKVKIQVTNDAHSMHPMQHPIHLHGQRFVVVSTNGVPNDNLVWKDTVLIQTGDTVELLVDMINPGQWMLHCHIAEHLEDGMMLLFAVIP